MRSLDEINQHLERGVMNVALLPKRDMVPDKYRDKQKFFALKKQTDSGAGITRWDPPSGDRCDLQSMVRGALVGSPDGTRPTIHNYTT